MPFHTETHGETLLVTPLFGSFPILLSDFLLFFLDFYEFITYY